MDCHFGQVLVSFTDGKQLQPVIIGCADGGRPLPFGRSRAVLLRCLPLSTVLTAVKETLLIKTPVVFAAGVYGERGGGWVTEEDEPWPAAPRTKARLKAERSWLHLHVRFAFGGVCVLYSWVCLHRQEEKERGATDL